MENILDQIGDTDIIKTNYKDNNLYLKMESCNPGLSIKDRVAKYIIKKLEEQYGNLKGRRIIEYSSGNLAIGLAQASKIYGFDLTLIVTSKTSPLKIALLKSYGADLIEVDEDVLSEDPLGFRGFAEKLAKSDPNAIFIDQYNNPLNPEAHYKETAPEIHNQIPGVDYVFCAMGTGGTASGIGKYFKENKEDANVIGVTPNKGIYYPRFHKLPDDSREEASKSIIEGVAEDFIPNVLDFECLKTVREVEDILALNEVDKLVKETGLFVGGSSGLALRAAKDYINELNLKDKDIVVICPDSGNRYLKSLNEYEENINSPYDKAVKALKSDDSKYPRCI